MAIPFHLLPVGQRFEYEGAAYVKTTPLIATHEQTGKQRLIPRSAEVRTGDLSPSSAESAKRSPSRNAILEALGNYHAACAKQLEELASGLSQDMVEKTRAEIAKAHTALLKRLDLEEQ